MNLHVYDIIVLISVLVDFNELLVQNAFSFLERLRKSKAVVKAITSFLEKIYAKCGDSVIHLPIASSILPLLVGQYIPSQCQHVTCVRYILSHILNRCGRFLFILWI
jgi:hypothetical protein